MSRIVETGYTISRYPSSILIERGTMSHTKYHDTAIQSIIQGGGHAAHDADGTPIHIDVKIAYGLDHALGFWWDLIMCGEKHDDSDDEVILSSQWLYPIGYRVTKTEFLSTFYLMYNDTMLKMRDTAMQCAKELGGWIEGHQYTMIDPRALYLILGDLDPERRHMVSTGQDGELRMAGILDMVHTYDAQFHEDVNHARSIQEARVGTHD